MEKSTSSITQRETGPCIGKNDTTVKRPDRMASVAESCARKAVLGSTWTARCLEVLEQYVKLQIYSLELPLSNIGLQTKFVPYKVVAYAGEEIPKPMQFIIKRTKIGTTTVYLQQVLTPYMGGYYTTTPGFIYNISGKKAAGIQRIIVNPLKIEEEIRKLVKEANRFLYMYCHLDET